MARYTVPGIDHGAAEQVAKALQERLTATLDLQLTLKHVHWNVVGPNFVSVHQMLDPWVAEVRDMSDTLAERIATLGFDPIGTPGFLAKHRAWDDYSLNRAPAEAHLAALDLVYENLVEDHRAAAQTCESLDPVSQDVLVQQSGTLEMHQWFLRAHLDDGSGALPHADTATERGAADRAR